MNRRSTRGELARYRKQLAYEEKLAYERYMRFALYLRLFGITGGVLYNPYDTDFAGFGFFLNWAKYVLGLEWYTDLLTALQEEPLRELVKLKEVPSDRSISRGHEGLHPRMMKHAYRDWLEELKHTGRLSGRLIAIDSTFLVVYGKTYQRVGRSYKPKGRKGYRLTLAYDVVSNLPICFLLAPANRSDSKMLLKTVNEVERFLGLDPNRIYLFDKGYWKGANFDILDKREPKVLFITLVKWYANITRTIDDQLVTDPFQGRRLAELTVNENGQDVPDFKGKLRVVAIDDRDATGSGKGRP